MISEEELRDDSPITEALLDEMSQKSGLIGQHWANRLTAEVRRLTDYVSDLRSKLQDKDENIIFYKAKLQGAQAGYEMFQEQNARLLRVARAADLVRYDEELHNALQAVQDLLGEGIYVPDEK